MYAYIYISKMVKKTNKIGIIENELILIKLFAQLLPKYSQ